MLEWIVSNGRLLAYQTVVVATVAIVLLRKRESAAALGWCLAVVFLPFAGLLMFWTFGLTRIPRRLKKKRRHRESFHEKFAAAASVERRRGEIHNLGTVSLMAERLGADAATHGNEVTFFHEGSEAFDAILEAVAGAGAHVHVFKYIFRNDGLGKRFLELLIEKARAGVEVRLIVDAAGSFGSWRMLRALNRAGGRGVVFMPFLAFGKRFVPNLRNHRKLVVVDGKTAFFGGLNVGDEYVVKRGEKRPWCDIHVRTRGSGVAGLQRIFAEDWDFAAGELLTAKRYFPASGVMGDSVLQVVAAGPDQDVNAIRQVYFAAITEARRRVLIASPYVVPDAAMRDALKTAALLGVEVMLLTQGPPPDHWISFAAQRFYYEEFLQAGVRIFEYDAGMMHAKMLLADDRLACVGTANLDNRSLVLNFELIGILESAADLAVLERRLLAEIAKSREIHLEEFLARGFASRLAEGAARLLSPLL